MKDMMGISQESMANAAEEASSCLRALSNPSRLLMLCQLVEGKKNVGQLEQALGLGQAYVSQQLARLRAEGLVSSEREGRVVHYSLADPRVEPVLTVLYQQYCSTEES